MDWGNLAQDRNKCWAVVNMVMSLWVSYSVGIPYVFSDQNLL